MFTDTHCHIHESNYIDGEIAYERALVVGVGRMIVVGTKVKSSEEAVNFARSHDKAWASLGIHPHDASSGVKAVETLAHILDDNIAKIVAIGEIGLDYFYDNSPREVQIELLHAQIKLAQAYNLPIIFHVREAFDDFWPIFDHYEGLRGVLHSFTDNVDNINAATSRGLYIGVNGISTFARDKQDMYGAIPLNNLLLETDAPYLTPVPLRGNVNEPAFVTHVAQHISNLQSINLQELSRVTEQNATLLFSI
ncbi:MAG: TatD family hydrolase [Candidatus Saccharimonadales bacterium]